MASEDYVFVCPKCDQIIIPDSAVLVRQYSARALHLPYLMCGKCRLIYADKTVIRQTISYWRNSSPGAKDVPYREICEKMVQYIEGVVEYYCRNASYKRAKFKKKLAKTP